MLASANELVEQEKLAPPKAWPPTFLHVPPFPDAKPLPFAVEGSERVTIDPQIAALLCDHRVGGSYWGAQPELPNRYWLTRLPVAAPLPAAASRDGLPVVPWPDEACDPWHMLAGAAGLSCQADDDAAIVAWLLGVDVWAAGADELRPSPFEAIAPTIPAHFLNPFTGDAMTVIEAIELSGFWRRMIDSNRGLAGGLGFAFWKQANVAPMLWDGSRPFRFLSSAPDGNAPVALWRAKAPPAAVAALEQREVSIVEVEDGFLRSSGLGADCIPPLSITVDRLGAYFDPARPSELENILQRRAFDPAILKRARSLRRHIVDAGLGKYGSGTDAMERPGGTRRHILVPGQVEDDRAVLAGGAGLTSNLELLRRVRADAPDAFIIYKPHPDVLAGHRAGAIVEKEALQYADRTVPDAAISPLIAMVDEVHVNSSLTGFEALLREKPVTTHGVPFYAGWGLTRDLGPVLERRNARLSLDELVAGALLAYPRYLDPVTRLPCPAEIAVERLITAEPGNPGLLVQLRRLQGKLRSHLRSLAR